MYGEFVDNAEFIGELEISKLMDLLKQTYELLKRLIGVIFNLVNQLHWIYNKADLLYKSLIKNNYLFYPLELLGKALTIPLKLDAIIKDNEDLTKHWNAYKKMLKFIKVSLLFKNIFFLKNSLIIRNSTQMRQVLRF